MEHPCETCLIKMICIRACQPFIFYSKNYNVDEVITNPEDPHLMYKRLVSSITQMVIKKQKEK